MRIIWTIGGPQGMGVDTSATLFGNIIASAGYHIYGDREYYSNIKGRHSFFKLVISDREVRSTSGYTDILSTFEPQSVFEHFLEVRKVVMYDEAAAATDIEKVNFMEPELRQTAASRLKEKGYGTTVAEAVKYMKDHGVSPVAIPYRQLLTGIAKNFKLPYPIIDRARNTIAISASCSLLGIDRKLVLAAIANSFKSDAFVKLNQEAAEKGYSLVSDDFHLRTIEAKGHRVRMDGNILSALGKMYGGLRFQSYYPITPASDESTFIEANQVVNDGNGGDGIVVLQSEDEIAAVNMAIGAALTGARAATATSGPGFALMAEGLSWAGMNEVPLVVTNYIRGGPSTGLPTRSGQEDLLFALHTGHGEFPRIVLASGDGEEVFKDAALAMNLAELYQTPVIHLIEKALANSFLTMDEDRLAYDSYRIVRGKIALEGQTGPRFAPSDDGISVRQLLGNGSIFYTGDEHNRQGHMREFSSNRIYMYEKRMKKLDTADSEIPEENRVNIFGEADTMILTWGSTKGVLLDAMDSLKDEGINIGMVQVRMFSPYPSILLRKMLAGRKVIAVENNYSAQGALYAREKAGIQHTNEILKYNGIPMMLEEVIEALKSVVKHDERRVVLSG